MCRRPHSVSQGRADLAVGAAKLQYRRERLRVLFGPLNLSGAAFGWSRAINHFAGDQFSSLTFEALLRGQKHFYFPVDISLSEDAALVNSDLWADTVLGRINVAISESAKPLLRNFATAHFARELPQLTAAGIHCGVLFHGSDIRHPDRHRDMFEHSLFGEHSGLKWSLLKFHVERNLKFVADSGVPVFVSTPDLIPLVPGAKWLPHVIDGSAFAGPRKTLGEGKLRVLHLPSNPLMKGTALIDPALQKLSAGGVIEYIHPNFVSRTEIGPLLRSVDVVVDQISLGGPGVLLAEALAAGCLVVSYLPDFVREQMPSPCPAISADPTNLGAIIADIAHHPDNYEDVQAGGPAWVRTTHDGSLAAQTFAQVFGVKGN
ncbi:MAG: hypothetical protein Q4A71_07710 [Actinomycetaceae bacterium]|nr:hypothetical protein [Actinomycetaceae bacterium]